MGARSLQFRPPKYYRWFTNRFWSQLRVLRHRTRSIRPGDRNQRICAPRSRCRCPAAGSTPGLGFNQDCRHFTFDRDPSHSGSSDTGGESNKRTRRSIGEAALFLHSLAHLVSQLFDFARALTNVEIRGRRLSSSNLIFELRYQVGQFVHVG